MSLVGIIDYGLGNIGSLLNIIEYVGGEAVVIEESNKLHLVDKIILPGVGNFKKGMENLKDLGYIEALNFEVIDKKKPILGICLGAQLLSKHSEEGNVSGLGWINANTVKFEFEDVNLKIPHMGWNKILVTSKNKILEGIDENDKFYFVHKYYLSLVDESQELCSTLYGNKFTSGVIFNNIIGLQFHPEKSHKYGMKIIKNFLSL